MGAPLCQDCGKRPATYISPVRKRRRANKEHSLCTKCWTAEMDRQRQKSLPDRHEDE